MVNFLGNTFGNNTEITLYDFSKTEEGELIKKSSGSKLELGGELSKSLKNIIKKYKDKQDNKIEYITKIPGKDMEGRLYRISTFFIKDMEKKLIGIMNIKVDITDMVISANYLNETLKELTGGPERNLKKESEEEEKYENTLEEYSQQLINKYFNEMKKPVDALSTNEKIEVIKELDKRGIFQLKGSIAELSKRFNTSEKTIYRYLKSNE